MTRPRFPEPGPRWLEARVPVRVRFSEVDALKIAWHGHYVTWLEEGREGFGRELGFGYQDVAAAGCLMVSNIKYHSFKDLDLKGRVPFVAILIVVLVFAVVFSDPPRILLLIFLAYAASGPVQYLLQLRRRKAAE